jgi:hypothetical protein
VPKRKLKIGDRVRLKSGARPLGRLVCKSTDNWWDVRFDSDDPEDTLKMIEESDLELAANNGIRRMLDLI